MKKTINVTQECIDKGKKRSREQCPIALAFKGIIVGTVAANYYHVEINGAWIPLPKEASRFINRFDSFYEQKVKPFKFKLDIPDKFLKSNQ